MTDIELIYKALVLADSTVSSSEDLRVYRKAFAALRRVEHSLAPSPDRPTKT